MDSPQTKHTRLHVVHREAKKEREKKRRRMYDVLAMPHSGKVPSLERLNLQKWRSPSAAEILGVSI